EYPNLLPGWLSFKVLSELVTGKTAGAELSGRLCQVSSCRLLSSYYRFCRAVEAPPLPELLGCPGEMTAPLKQCVAWLDAYFHEPAALKDLPLPAIHHPVFQRDSFTRQVLWKLLKVVRLGETVSYRQLAALAGRPRAARAVGGAMRTNPLPILIPCHRVVCSSGAVGNYSAGRATKEWLLAHEGRLVTVVKGLALDAERPLEPWATTPQAGPR
uniref:Methylated-DNA--protein-cysteine methyltransferase n=1 Tax=Panthera tigris altaica TaxID=74533 RepID=A0A8C9JB24_PANTA